LSGSGFGGSRFSPAAGLKSGQFNQKKNYIFVINDVVSYKRFRGSGVIGSENLGSLKISTGETLNGKN
jgi:hypothetical protein